jgi:hypothetical protein
MLQYESDSRFFGAIDVNDRIDSSSSHSHFSAWLVRDRLLGALHDRFHDMVELGLEVRPDGRLVLVVGDEGHAGS